MAVITTQRLGLAAAAGDDALQRDRETGSWSSKGDQVDKPFGQLKPTPGDAFKSVPREG
jgi:hypothetical protein